MRTITRRSTLKAGASLIGLSFTAGCVGNLGGGGGGYPSEEFILINPYSPGGGTDIYFSQFVDPLSEELGVEVRQEYKPGADGAVAMREIQNDETAHKVTNIDVPLQTLLQWDLGDDAGFDIREFAPILSWAPAPTSLVVRADSDYTDFETLRSAYQSGEISAFGGVGTGNAFHLGAWAAKRDWGLDWQEYIGYDGAGPVISAVLSGEVPVGMSTAVPAAPYVEEGDIAIPITLAEQSPVALPEKVPTPGDLGLETGRVTAAGVIYRAVYGPPVMDEDQQTTIEDAFMAVLESDEIQQWAEENNNPIDPDGAEKLAEFTDRSFELKGLYEEFKAEVN